MTSNRKHTTAAWLDYYGNLVISEVEYMWDEKHRRYDIYTSHVDTGEVGRQESALADAFSYMEYGVGWGDFNFIPFPDIRFHYGAIPVYERTKNKT